MTQPTKDRVFIMNDGKVERIVPELAVEIGLNESILLLQIDFWIGISDHFIGGRWWTYQSTREMKDKAFPYWGIGTIHRTVVSLEKQGLVIVGNHNKRPGDKTRWFALDRDGMKRLSKKCPSVQFISPERDETPDDYTQGLEHQRNTSGTPRSKMEQPVPERNGSFQNGTTLPESTPENTQKDSAANAAPKPRKRRKKPAIPAEQINPMKDAIHAAFKYPAWTEMTTNEKGKINAAAKQLCAAGKTPADVPVIYEFCESKYDNFTPLALASHANEALRSKNGSSCSPAHQHIHKAPERLPATNIVSDEEFYAARRKFEAEVFGDTSA